MDANPRKLPRQSRSKATFDAIVEATTQLLLREGYDRFTTARVASRAGVSIGSLYQYFPNKTALAVAVIDRCCEDFVAAFESRVAAPEAATLEEAVRALVHETLASHHLEPDLHRIVNDLARRIGVADRTDRVSRSAARMIETMLRRHIDEIRPEIDVAAAATMIEGMLEGLSHRVQLTRPAILPGDVLARETMQLILRYLSSTA
jgi:AcrR family transcriptional regulator